MAKKKTALPECEKCGGKCCYDLIEPQFTPQNEEDADAMHWALRYPSVELGIDSDGEFEQIHRGPCMHLDPGGRCSIYDRRPAMCREYGPPLCRGDRSVSGEPEYAVVFTNPDQFAAWWAARKAKRNARRRELAAQRRESK